MIEYYSGLMREAEQREALALWRVKRLRLDGRRKEFLLSQQDNITAELETNPLPNKVCMSNKIPTLQKDKLPVRYIIASKFILHY